MSISLKGVCRIAAATSVVSTAALLGLAPQVVGIAPAVAQSLPAACDQVRLKATERFEAAHPKDAMRYAVRSSSYCEGFDPVLQNADITIPIDLVSLTTTVAFDKASKDSVAVGTAVPFPDRLHLTLRTSRNFGTYQLDAEVSGGPLQWSPAPVYGQTRFSPTDLIALAVSQGTGAEVIVPLVVGPSVNEAHVSQVTLAVRPRVQLKNLMARWTSFVDGGCEQSNTEPFPVSKNSQIPSVDVRTVTLAAPDQEIACLSLWGETAQGEKRVSPDFQIYLGKSP